MHSTRNGSLARTKSINEIAFRCVLVSKIFRTRVQSSGGVLIVPSSATGDRSQEFHVDLLLMAGQRLLIPLETLLATPVSHVRWEPVHARALQQPPDSGLADRQGVISTQVHADASRPEVVVPPQI